MSIIDELSQSLAEFYAIVEGGVQELLTEKPQEYHHEGFVDGDVTEEEWETYREYLQNIKEGFEDFKTHTYEKPHVKGVHLKTLAINALVSANKKRENKGMLRDLWQRNGLNYPIGAYADFDDSPSLEHYWRQYIEDETMNRSIFRDTDKIKLTLILIEKIIHNNKLIKQGFINSCFNFHNNFELYGKHRFEEEEKEKRIDKLEFSLLSKKLFEKEVPKGLSNFWKNIFIPPVTKIRNYFGEKIALYFAFLTFYNIMLIFPSIICVPVFVIQAIYTDGETIADVANVVFTIMMVIWSALFYELWKRKETTYSIEWGQTDFEEDEVEKATFHGIIRRSPIHDRREKYFSYLKRAIRVSISILVTALLIAIDIGIIFGLFRLRYYLYDKWKGNWYADYSITIVSILNAIIILIFNYIFFYVSFLLTHFENFKTQTEFEKSIIIKNFVFQFVNCYNSLFYIAFLKRDIEGCLDYDSSKKLVLSKDYLCFNEIYAQLRSIFVIAILKNIVEIGTPFLFELYNKRTKAKRYKSLMESKEDKDKLLLRIEKNADKSSYGYEELDGTYYDYQEILIQMGYILLFGLAFPLCIILAFINNIIEHQVDRAKILYFSRRPTPIGGENIGSWRIILYVLMIVGVFCYSGILCITALTFSDSTKDSFTEFVWCSIIFLMIKWGVSYVIPDVPENLEMVMKRHLNIVDKYLVGMPETSKEDKDLTSNSLTNLAAHCRHEEYLNDKESCDVSGEVKEGKIEYDKKKSRMAINGKATSQINTSNIAFINKKAKEGLKRGVSVDKKQPNLDVRRSTNEVSSSLYISDFSSDSNFYDEDEAENSEEESSEDAVSKSQSDEDD